MGAHRINILGASGSGTTTLGRAVAERLSISHFDSDDYYHGPSDPPFQNPRSAVERCALIERDLQNSESWVLSGGVAGWEPFPRLDFTLTTFLWVPTHIRLQRLRDREAQRFGDRIRPGGDMHAAHAEFLDWASRYDVGDVEGKTLARHRAYLATRAEPVLELRDDAAVQALVEQVVAAIGR